MIYAYFTNVPNKPKTKIMIFLPPLPSILGISIIPPGTSQTFLKDTALLTVTDEGTDLSSQVSYHMTTNSN